MVDTAATVGSAAAAAGNHLDRGLAGADELNMATVVLVVVVVVIVK